MNNEPIMEENPPVVSYRLSQVEKKIDLILEKVDGVALLEYRVGGLEKSRNHMFTYLATLSLGIVAYVLEQVFR